MDTETELTQPNRRKHRRFAMELELRYTLTSGQTGTGEVLNMSTGGMLFRCGTVLPIGELIRADLTWPFLLEGGESLELRVHGMVLRSDLAGTAISISKYQIHAAGRKGDTES
ncbi:MAG TPA: PilZ domain-containing protein [Bryobacteraceae bacterium]|nr:PilZ domain-containing protein [Bryobacteraceae bacterium]